MPSDIDGNNLKVGDMVTVELAITAVHPETGNLTLQTVEAVNTVKTTVVLNAKQVMLES